MKLIQCLLLLGYVGAAVSAAADAQPPADWAAKVDAFNAFFAENDDGLLDSTGYPKGLYLPTIGNGYLSHAKGVRSDTMHISGVFNGETTSPSHRASLPALFAFTVMNSTTTGVLLDIESGVYHRRGALADGATYEMRWYAHMSQRSLYVLEVDVQLNGLPSATLHLSSNTLAQVTDFSPEEVQALGAQATVRCMDTLIPETGSSPTCRVCVAADTVPSALVASTSSHSFVFVSAYRTSLEVSSAEEVQQAAVSEYKAAVSSKASLLTAHAAAWAGLWASGIEVSGRPDVSVAANASLFAILSSARQDWPQGLAPGGLTNYYNGHSFWDTETWMLPPLLFLQPQLARSLLDYRSARLPGAYTKALSYSPPWAGAMFPWESASSGVETCPLFAATGLREDHISGDIAFALWQHWALTRDKLWLQSTAWPMLQGIADFWVSRSTPEGALYHIKDVIPPDEYVDHVEDSAYTNTVAALALSYAAQAAEVLNISCTACKHYLEVAQGLALPTPANGAAHPEYLGYAGQLVKQADVVLLHYPLGLQMSDEQRRTDLQFYSERTDAHGPAMTWGMHAIGFLDLGMADEAAKYLNMSFQDNLHAPLRVWTETPDGNAVNFITGAGGFLQTLIAGYPGVRIAADLSLTVTPSCVQGADRIKLRGLHYLSTSLDIEYTCAETATTPEEVSFTVTSSDTAALSVSLSSDRVHLVPGMRRTFRAQGQQRMVFSITSSA